MIVSSMPHQSCNPSIGVSLLRVVTGLQPYNSGALLMLNICCPTFHKECNDSLIFHVTLWQLGMIIFYTKI